MHRLSSAEAEPFAKYLLNLSRKLKFHYGTRNRFQEPGLELSSEATYAGVPVRQPYAYSVPSFHNRDLSYRLCSCERYVL